MFQDQFTALEVQLASWLLRAAATWMRFCGLTDYLRPELGVSVPAAKRRFVVSPVNAYNFHALRLLQGPQVPDEDEDERPPERLEADAKIPWARCALMLTGAAVILTLLDTTLLAVPLLFGRWVLMHLEAAQNNDFYPWLLGTGLLMTLAYGIVNTPLTRWARQWRTLYSNLGWAMQVRNDEKKKGGRREPD